MIKGHELYAGNGKHSEDINLYENIRLVNLSL
jgi:hypothetical protein